MRSAGAVALTWYTAGTHWGNVNDKTYRILDASLNRATEGLRTLEEFARFVLEDRGLCESIKSLRHDLAAALSALPREDLLVARDSEGDVGSTIQVADEYRRTGIADVVAAAIARTQQSLRCLEEYSKIVDERVSRECESLRYRLYSLTARLERGADRAGDPGRHRRRRLDDALLYALIEAEESEDTFVRRIRELSVAGVDVFQLRDAGANDRRLYERSLAGTRVCRDVGTLFIVNDRADIARAADADGVHVGQDELPAAAARQIIGSDRLLGVSTHDVNQVREAVLHAVDYIGCGPMFAGRTKSFDRYVGVKFLTEAVAAAGTVPAFAIGGIDQSNLDAILMAGGTRIAVTGAIRDADDPAAVAGELKRRLLDTIHPIDPKHPSTETSEGDGRSTSRTVQRELS